MLSVWSLLVGEGSVYLYDWRRCFWVSWALLDVAGSSVICALDWLRLVKVWEACWLLSN